MDQVLRKVSLRLRNWGHECLKVEVCNAVALRRANGEGHVAVVSSCLPDFLKRKKESLLAVAGGLSQNVTIIDIVAPKVLSELMQEILQGQQTIGRASKMTESVSVVT